MDDMAQLTPDQRPLAARIDTLLADANRLRARGDFEAAEKCCREALLLAPGNAPAHELLGDLFYQRRRGDAAIDHYRLARAADPQRAILEDKIGRASLLIAEAHIMRVRAEELLAGKRNQIPRRPGVSAVLSLVMPGFGQIYNGEYLKGAAIVCVWLMLMLGMGASALGSLQGSPRGDFSSFDLGAVLGVFFSPPALWWMLPTTALWLYSITEAALRAAKTMTAPEDLA